MAKVQPFQGFICKAKLKSEVLLSSYWDVQTFEGVVSRNIMKFNNYTKKADLCSQAGEMPFVLENQDNCICAAGIYLYYHLPKLN